MTYAAVSWSHSSGSTGRKSLPSSYLEHAGHKNRGKGGINTFLRTSAHGIKKKVPLFCLFCCSVGGIERNVFLQPHTHPGKEEVHGQTSCGSSRVWPGFNTFNIHSSLFSTLTYGPPSPWTRVCPSLQGDSGQRQWSLCWPGRTRWTA